MDNTSMNWDSKPNISSSTTELNSVSCVNTSTQLHHFEIRDYSLSKGLGIGKAIHSTTFSAGGYRWRISCFLDGETEQFKDYMAVFLLFYPISGEKAKVKFGFCLLDHTNGARRYSSECINVVSFSSSFSSYGWPRFIRRDVLEASSCLRNDTITIIGKVTIIGDPRTYNGRDPPIVKPAVLRQQLGTLLSIERGADINFEVDGQSFPAHRSVVAASSPVFRAQLSGLMKEGKDQSIKISDIEAPVFEALLLYIYTGNLPDVETFTATGMAQHLLVAADRFGMDNLKTSCEKKLCEQLDVSNVCTSLALADQHSLSKLKNACLKYLSSPKAFISSVATDGFVHLIHSCPGIAKEIHNRVDITDLK